jgi:hypothetical protein
MASAFAYLHFYFYRNIQCRKNNEVWLGLGLRKEETWHDLPSCQRCFVWRRFNNIFVWKTNVSFLIVQVIMVLIHSVGCRFFFSFSTLLKMVTYFQTQISGAKIWVRHYWTKYSYLCLEWRIILPWIINNGLLYSVFAHRTKKYKGAPT